LNRILQRDEILCSDIILQSNHDDLLRRLQDRGVLGDLLLHDLFDFTMRGIICLDRFDAIFHQSILLNLLADQGWT